MKINFPGTIKLGRLLVDDRRAFDKNLLSFPNEARVIVSVWIQKKGRSLKQNKYYWKYIVKMLADELGYDKDSMHETLKAKFLREPHETIPGVFRVKSTTELSTVEFIKYYKEVQIWASDFLNIYLPDPNE